MCNKKRIEVPADPDTWNAIKILEPVWAAVYANPLYSKELANTILHAIEYLAETGDMHCEYKEGYDA